MDDLRDTFFDFLDAQPAAVFAAEGGKVVYANPAGSRLAPDALGGDAGALFGEELARPGAVTEAPWRELRARGSDLGTLRLVTVTPDDLPLQEERELVGGAAVKLHETLGAGLYQLFEATKKAREAGNLGALRDLAAMDRSLCQGLRVARNLGRLYGGADSLPKFARLELGALVRDILTSVVFFSKGRDVKLDFACAEPVELAGDRRLLEIMVMELVSNAIKRTAPGGTVTVAVGVSGGTAVIRVADNGTGRDTARQKALEERLGIPAPALDPDAGAGLGLRVSRRMAALHGGAVITQTLPDGSGTVATAALPIRSPETVILSQPPEDNGCTAFDILIEIADIADESVYELRETL